MTSTTAHIPPTIFHYTSAAGLLGIVEKRQLWVSDIEFLNDQQEMRYAIEQLRAILADSREKIIYREPESPDTNRKMGYYDALLRAIDDHFPADDGFHNFWERIPYVASFCREGDLLSMWRGYTHGPGFAIEFDTKTLLDALSSEPHNSGLSGDEYEELRLFNCGVDADFFLVEYGKTGAEAVIFELFNKISIQRDPASSELADSVLNHHLVDFTRIKHPAFSEEQEVRFVVFRNGDLSPRPKLRAANGHLVPYYPLVFSHKAIRSIRVGPSMYRNRSRIALERWLHSSLRNEYGHVEVHTSNAPLLY